MISIRLILPSFLPQLRSHFLLLFLPYLSCSILNTAFPFVYLFAYYHLTNSTLYLYISTLRLETMISIRETCDAAEAECPANLWTLATYKELQFIDAHVE